MERINNEIGNQYNELAALEKEKKNADKSAQLDYTIQIQEAQMGIKRSEYEKEEQTGGDTEAEGLHREFGGGK